MHVLARARATVVAARQSEGQLLLDTCRRPPPLEDFEDQAEQVFRVQGQATCPPRPGRDRARRAPAATSPGAGGDVRRTRARRPRGAALVAFGDSSRPTPTCARCERRRPRGARATFEGAQRSAALNRRHRRHQGQRPGHVRRPCGRRQRRRRVGVAAAGAAAGVLLLVLAGLYLRSGSTAT